MLICVTRFSMVKKYVSIARSRAYKAALMKTSASPNNKEQTKDTKDIIFIRLNENLKENLISLIPYFCGGIIGVFAFPCLCVVYLCWFCVLSFRHMSCANSEFINLSYCFFNVKIQMYIYIISTQI